MSRHNFTRDDVRLDQLDDELTVALKRPVALSAQMPSVSEGGVGVLVIIGEDGGEIDVDDATVQAAIASHSPAPEPADPAEALESALTAANSVAGLKNALLSYATSQKRPKPTAATTLRRPGT